VLPLQTGCYYGHLASGQWKLLWRRQPIEVAVRDDATPERTRALLRLVGSVRAFATELGLVASVGLVSAAALAAVASSLAIRYDWLF